MSNLPDLEVGSIIILEYVVTLLLLRNSNAFFFKLDLLLVLLLFEVKIRQHPQHVYPSPFFSVLLGRRIGATYSPARD